jgi:hypothetical protein
MQIVENGHLKMSQNTKNISYGQKKMSAHVAANMGR